MSIGRSQMSKQLEPGLGSKDLRRLKKVIRQIHGKKFKPYSKKSK